MSMSSLLCISITLLVAIVTVQSVHHVYLYDSGNGDQEHCCLVKVRQNYCLATPITRSLVQVNKQCHRFDGPRRRRWHGQKDNETDSKAITHRLEVQMAQEVGQNILIELSKPLEKNILKNDLVCLTTTNKKMNLDKCYVELTDDHTPRRQKQDRQEHQKHAVAEEETTVEAENERYRVELEKPIRVSEGYGLSLRRAYTIDAKNVRPTDRKERKCWSWYRSQIRRIRRNPTDQKKSCVRLTDDREHCINQLLRNTKSPIDQKTSSTVSFPRGSKLFCKNELGSSQFLGNYNRGQLCFYLSDRISVELKFTDIAGISDGDKNRDVLQFIAHDEKLAVELDDDCHNQTRLVEVSEPKLIKN